MSKGTYNKEWTAYYEYLEFLRQSGATNMFGAAPYLQDHYGLEKREAELVLHSWMKNYNALLEDGVISND
tara:strand:+ start:2516 stop:2725 length:210 start_codon:yes stop_codon:yes gene_type:complete